ncbi:MAG: hypothetical protein LBQ51_05490 [Desulfovibrio sp.]|jgi:hypothetical protein|nr:hypothetical protein [Desulfovibrio sp.]
MKTYTAVYAVLHNGKTYAPGESPELEDEAAAPLLQCGAIRESGGDTAAPPSANKKGAGETGTPPAPPAPPGKEGGGDAETPPAPAGKAGKADKTKKAGK